MPRLAEVAPLLIQAFSIPETPITPPAPGAQPALIRLGLIPGTLATTALQAVGIDDPNLPELNLVYIGSITGGAYTNLLRLSYPAATADSAFPSSVTITRAAVGGRAAYTETTTARSAITTRGSSKQADYQLAANPVRSVFVQTHDTIQLDFSFATPDRPGSITVTGTNVGGRNPFEIVITIRDADGVARVTAAALTASDGTIRDITADFDQRTDANTLSYDREFRNARWRAGTVSVTYADGNSVSSTLAGNWRIA